MTRRQAFKRIGGLFVCTAFTGVSIPKSHPLLIRDTTPYFEVGYYRNGVMIARTISSAEVDHNGALTHIMESLSPTDAPMSMGEGLTIHNHDKQIGRMVRGLPPRLGTRSTFKVPVGPDHITSRGVLLI